MCDSDVRTSFDQQETYKIFLDLMYEHKRYDVVVEQYKQIRAYLLLYERAPANTLNCLVFAACYHLVNITRFYSLERDSE